MPSPSPTKALTRRRTTLKANVFDSRPSILFAPRRFSSSLLTLAPTTAQQQLPFSPPPETLMSDYDLRSVILNPSEKPVPRLEVILVTGDTTHTTAQLCSNLAQDFDAVHIDVAIYLVDLANVSDSDPAGLQARRDEALGLLHPSGLRMFLRENRREGVDCVPVFVLPILERWLKEEVKGGKRRFLVSGLEGFVESAVRFGEKIAKPVAVISFEIREWGILRECEGQKGIDEIYRDVVLDVGVEKMAGLEKAYSRLLAAMFEKVAGV